MEEGANAVAQLGGRGLRVSGNENLAGREVVLGDETEKESRESIGFPGAGAGFEERDAGREIRGAQIECRGHNSTSLRCARSGPKTRSAISCQC